MNPGRIKLANLKFSRQRKLVRVLVNKEVKQLHSKSCSKYKKYLAIETKVHNLDHQQAKQEIYQMRTSQLQQFDKFCARLSPRNLMVLSRQPKYFLRQDPDTSVTTQDLIKIIKVNSQQLNQFDGLFFKQHRFAQNRSFITKNNSIARSVSPVYKFQGKQQKPRQLNHKNNYKLSLSLDEKHLPKNRVSIQPSQNDTRITIKVSRNQNIHDGQEKLNRFKSVQRGSKENYNWLLKKQQRQTSRTLRRLRLQQNRAIVNLIADLERRCKAIKRQQMRKAS